MHLRHLQVTGQTPAPSCRSRVNECYSGRSIRPLAHFRQYLPRPPGKRGVFEVSQDEIIVPQTAYETAYDKIYPIDKFVGINDKNKTFQTALGTPMTIISMLKAIHDEASEIYSVEDGRMSAMLGLTKPGS